MKVLLSIILGLAISASCLAKTVEVKGASLSFEVKDNKVRASASGDSYNFSFTNGKSFTLSPAPEIKPAMIETTAKKMADEVKTTFKSQKKKNSITKVKSFVHTASFGIFSGQEAQITSAIKDMASNTKYVKCAYILILFDGKSCWIGTFACGFESEIAAVHNILKTAKRIK